MILGFVYFLLGCPQIATNNFTLGGNVFSRIDQVDCEDLEAFINHSDLTKRFDFWVSPNLMILSDMSKAALVQPITLALLD